MTGTGAPGPAPGGPGPPDLRLGLVGCGRLAEMGYLPAIAGAHGVRLAAVADPDPARRALSPAGVSRFSDASALLAAGEVDAVIVASPVERHLEDARAAADAQVPALVEKPPAPDAAGAARLAELAPPPWVGFNRRFARGAERLRTAAAAAGDEVDLRLVLHYRRESWAPVSVSDDALLDLGPHLLDLAAWLGGGSIAAVSASSLSPSGAELELELPRGRARISCANDRAYRELIELRGAQGRPKARERSGGLLAGVAGRLRPPAEHPLVSSLRAQVEAFVRAVSGGPSEPLGTASEGLEVMRALDAARRSGAGHGERVGPART